MNTDHVAVELHDEEQFDLPHLLYAAASALIPYLGAVVLVLLGGPG